MRVRVMVRLSVRVRFRVRLRVKVRVTVRERVQLQRETTPSSTDCHLSSEKRAHSHMWVGIAPFQRPRTWWVAGDSVQAQVRCTDGEKRWVTVDTRTPWRLDGWWA